MKRWKLTAVAVFFAIVHVAGCSSSGKGGGGGSNGGMPSGDDIVLSGTVFNNYTDAEGIDRSVAGARVVLVKADDVKAADSVSPVEDLAYEGSSYPAATTDSDGFYRFTVKDFSDTYPARSTYYIFVDPPIVSSGLLPGGSACRSSLALDGTTAVHQDVTLTDTTGPDATYIGTVLCLVCHKDKNPIKHTLHFAGIRKIGPGGTIVNGLMNMSDTSVYDLSDNNQAMLDKFTDPATSYAFADDSTRTFWLGKDVNGLYFQLTSNASPKFYIKFSYGGETGLWRGLFMTTVYAGTGIYAENHGPDGGDYAYFVFAPFQYNEASGSIYGGSFVAYDADNWDFEGTGNNGFTGDSELSSFDLGCSVCHGAAGVKTENKGMATQRRVAVFPRDYDGYEIDGILSQVNVGCEKCHGPGSNHYDEGGRGHKIISPGMLPAGRLAIICGSCHINGENHTEFGGGAPLRADGKGNYENFYPGMSAAQFFGTSDGTGNHVIPFGTMAIASLLRDGYLEPVDFETNEKASWMDIPFGAVVNHSKASQQHYLDLVRTVKFRNDREILTCISCHDAHGSPYRHMVDFNTDNNALCLSCHSGSGQVFPNIEQGMVDRLKNDADTPEDRTVIGKDVEEHLFDKTGSYQMGPYDPEITAMGRCTLCHMPDTARSADWRNALLTKLGQYRRGDIRSHTFDVMMTEAVNDMGSSKGAMESTPAGISHECGDCHRFAGLN